MDSGRKVMTVRSCLYLLILTISISAGFAQYVPQDRSCDVAYSALRDARLLRPGMKRRDVEKNFGPASLTFPVKSVYVYRRCPTIHIEVVFKQAPGKDPSFSPDDEIENVSRPYLDDVTKD